MKNLDKNYHEGITHADSALKFLENDLIISERMVEDNNFNFINLPIELQNENGAKGLIEGLRLAIDEIKNWNKIEKERTK